MYRKIREILMAVIVVSGLIAVILVLLGFIALIGLLFWKIYKWIGG